MVKKSILSVMLLCSIGWGDSQKGNLIEFSTSMDFEEFKVVLKELKLSNAEYGDELSKIISTFKKSTNPGESLQVTFKSEYGYLIFEREDQYAFTLRVFSTKKEYNQLDYAYKVAIKKLNI